MTRLEAPVDAFSSASGRSFTVGDGEHSERYPNDSLWSDRWPILFDGEEAGYLHRNLNYGRGETGEPRWTATIRQLYWRHAEGAPTGIGFDVSVFDTAEEALEAWGHSADEILDWEAGKPVRSIYSKTGSFQREIAP